MGWEKIARRGHGRAPAVSRDGCAVSTRRYRLGGRALVIALGPALVARMGWAGETALEVSAGTGPDAGRLRLSRAEEGRRGWPLGGHLGGAAGLAGGAPDRRRRAAGGRAGRCLADRHAAAQPGPAGGGVA